MRYLSRLLGLGLLSLLIMLLAMSCESSKSTANEFGSPNRMKGETIEAVESRQIVHFTDSTTEYKASRSSLAKAFIQQFADGTVIDKIQVQKAPADPGVAAVYYLIGTGLRNGMYRAMALPLTPGGDNTYYLRPGAERYTLSSVGCPACFYSFSGGRISGTTCSENTGGSYCDLKKESGNTLFATK